MNTVALIYGGESFMPEIAAYQHYFHQNGIDATILVNPSQSAMEPFDVLWFFMGVHVYLSNVNKNKFIVHEYCSGSTPPFAILKNKVKKIVNMRPDLRVTLTPEHKGFVFPDDGVPLITRKQGIHYCFYEQTEHSKEYDFIYTGSASDARKTDKWLRTFIHQIPHARILLVGNHDPRIVKQFSANSNIHFHLPVGITSLPSLLATASYAVNYVPDVYPYNIQPSTKLQEYCAAGCRIISNSYFWARNFSEIMKPGIFFLDNGCNNLSINNLERFSFTTPDMKNYRWERIFESMQLLAIFTPRKTSKFEH